ncbi:MAG: (2Fe-2S)-binding protein [Proteobacteria bacterium]|nr:(2Fe-2S)-binding protein [Pseudomonadota bacterium]
MRNVNGGLTVRFTLNGEAVEIRNVPPMERLLDTLRERARVTGTKEGCGEGECGACTVLIDGAPSVACLVPTCQVDGEEVVTVEGLAEDGRLSALQSEFLAAGGAQCGICTPGFLVAARALLDANASPTRAEIREGLAGNLCRCTGYQKIVDGVERAAEQERAGDAG